MNSRQRTQRGQKKDFFFMFLRSLRPIEMKILVISLADWRHFDRHAAAPRAARRIFPARD